MRRFINYWLLLRPKQWIKNGFVVAPLFFSGNFISSDAIICFVSFLSFVLLSSSVYILNDLTDIEADKLHKKKKIRPLASGAVSKFEAVIILLLLLCCIIALSISFNYSTTANLLLFLYALINLGYSFGLKHIPILELLMVASGFVIRLMFGASTLAISLSPWIIMCTGLLSLMLAVGKRRGDLVQSNDQNLKRHSLKGYNLTYLDQINTVAAAAVFTSYIIFCTSSYAITQFGEEVLSTSVFVLFGILIYLKLLAVDGLGDDPTSLVLKNRGIRFTVICWIINFIIIIYF